MIPRLLLTASICALPAALLAPPLSAQLPQKGEPAITAQTERSGGVLTPEQTALRFDHADLAFEVLPDTRTLNGVATLAFTATAIALTGRLRSRSIGSRAIGAVAVKASVATPFSVRVSGSTSNTRSA